MKKLACRDVGIDCDFVAEGETTEEVLQKGMEHAKTSHNMTDADMTPEMMEKVKAAVKDA